MSNINFTRLNGVEEATNPNRCHFNWLRTGILFLYWAINSTGGELKQGRQEKKKERKKKEVLRVSKWFTLVYIPSCLYITPMGGGNEGNDTTFPPDPQPVTWKELEEEEEKTKITKQLIFLFSWMMKLVILFFPSLFQSWEKIWKKGKEIRKQLSTKLRPIFCLKGVVFDLQFETQWFFVLPSASPYYAETSILHHQLSSVLILAC